MGKGGGQVHNNKHARKGGTIRNMDHGLERHHWCNHDIYAGVTHAVNDMRVSVELYKEPHVTAATPAAAAAADAVVMVTITMVRVDQATKGSNASLT